MEFKNSIYVAEVIKIENDFGNFNYKNRDFGKKLGFYNKKIMVVPNFLFGKIFNITVEYYNVSEKEIVRGIPAAGNGWHKPPYGVYTYTPKDFNLIFKDIIFKELD